MMFQFKNIDSYRNSFLQCGNKEKSIEWMEYFFNIARAVSQKSKDKNTKVGCIAVDPLSKRILATGYNGFPSGVRDDDERWERPMKYSFVVHAEANVISAASRFGIPLQDSVLFITMHPCVDCAKLIASVGFSEIVYIDDGVDVNPTQEWHKKLQIAKQIFDESGIIVYSSTNIVSSQFIINRFFIFVNLNK